MRSIKILFQFLAVISLIAFLGLHTFVSIKGKKLLTRKLHSVFQSEVSVGRVTTSFPFQLIVKDIKVKDWFKIRKALAGMGAIDVLGGNFILSDLTLEGAEFELSKEKRGEEPKTMPVNLQAVSANAGADNFPLPEHIILKRLVISDGIYTYIDHTKSETPIKITVKDLNVKIDNFQWPFSSSEVTSFNISGRVPWDNIKEEGWIELKGWINFYKKDLRAKLQIKDIDGIYIYPYYSSWVNIDKAHVEKARLNLTSDITSLNNEVNAPCHLELVQIAFKPKGEEEETRQEKVTNAVLGLLRSMNQGKIVLDFNLKTKLDNPEFGLGVIEAALKDKIFLSRKGQDSGAVSLIKFPGKIIAGTLTSATDLTRSVINCTVNVGNELRRAVGASFTKECVPVDSGNTSAAVNQTK
jgi:hypothetical protein